MSNATKKRIAEIVEQYKQAKGIEDGRVDVHDLAGWALDNKLYQPNMRDEIQLAANTFSRHFREELRADSKGRSYRAKHAVRQNINGKQSTFLWRVRFSKARGRYWRTPRISLRLLIG
ncbi:hypothetical protein [Neisseria lactamica]|uniref:hypothetical protein n=1 Tax=Neisseria lactamica TaxID=486 RepID=UPI001EFE602B|nr:hypothetical protein [Neisseria lactamica]